MNELRDILLVEDDKVDARTTIQALKEINVINNIVHVKNGLEAYDYLNKSSKNLPCLILLDINMPVMNGIEFMKAKSGDSKINEIPTIVLTTSTSERDRYEVFRNGISGFMNKPVDYIQFIGVMRTVNLSWSLM